jgi:C1A family cysteine protease
VQFKNGASRGLGWLPDVPDARDSVISLAHSKATQSIMQVSRNKSAFEAVSKRLEQFSNRIKPRPKRGYLARKRGEIIPTPKFSVTKAEDLSYIDLRAYCSPIEDQGSLGSCSAQAAIGLVEMMERRWGGEYVDASALFVYKATRNLLGWTGDTGGYLRTAMKALRLFGAAPEEFWPYEIDNLDIEPTPAAYACAQNYKTLQYARLDSTGIGGEELLQAIKGSLCAECPVMFGFNVFESLDHHADIPFPGPIDRAIGGHAVLAVGYDDHRPNTFGPGQPLSEEDSDIRERNRNGALLIRNSWGTEWGDEGYGWLPYGYVTDGHADDFWIAFLQDWVLNSQFEDA